MDSIILSTGKSNRCFNNFLSLESFYLLGNLTVVSTIFCSWIIGDLSKVSVFSSIKKSNRCFNNFCAWFITNLSMVSIFF